MKTSEVQNALKARAAFLAASSKQQIKAASLCMVTLLVVFVLPQFVPAPFGQIVMAVGAAASFNASLCLFPESFRSRTGSLTPAVYLLVFVWLCAAVTILLTVDWKALS